MKINDILNRYEHRNTPLPEGDWLFYQEWNNAIFLHWDVSIEELRPWIPRGLEIDTFDGKPYISLVAFDMERIRPRFLPAFPPISNFHEINVRTYIRHQGKPGVYFLSIEGQKFISCAIAKFISNLPYRAASMQRSPGEFHSTHSGMHDSCSLRYQVGDVIEHKTPLELWLTERYALYLDGPGFIDTFEIHHIEWPLNQILLPEIKISYPRFGNMLKREPVLSHFSPGVRVIAWRKKRQVNP
jgi:uncharacterized protein YqjF (DUF2071 family)